MVRQMSPPSVPEGVDEPEFDTPIPDYDSVYLSPRMQRQLELLHLLENSPELKGIGQ